MKTPVISLLVKLYVIHFVISKRGRSSLHFVWRLFSMVFLFFFSSSSVIAEQLETFSCWTWQPKREDGNHGDVFTSTFRRESLLRFQRSLVWSLWRGSCCATRREWEHLHQSMKGWKSSRDFIRVSDTPTISPTSCLAVFLFLPLTCPTPLCSCLRRRKGLPLPVCETIQQFSPYNLLLQTEESRLQVRKSSKEEVPEKRRSCR